MHNDWENKSLSEKGDANVKRNVEDEWEQVEAKGVETWKSTALAEPAAEEEDMDENDENDGNVDEMNESDEGDFEGFGDSEERSEEGDGESGEDELETRGKRPRSNLFVMGDEELHEGNGKKRYERISHDPQGTLQKISFVKRDSVYRDGKYSAAFALHLVVSLMVGFASYKVDYKHHYLGTLVIGLALSGAINSAMVASHYRLFQFSIPTPFSAENLRYVQPVEGLLLSCVALAIWWKGWSVIVGLIPIAIALFDSSRILHSSDSLQFASVVLDMASELVIVDDQLAPVIRKTWQLFLVQNCWLVLWTSLFVDAASGSDHVSFAAVAYLFFSLFWTTQVIRSILSFYVTGSAVYRLVLAQDMFLSNTQLEESEEDRGTNVTSSLSTLESGNVVPETGVRAVQEILFSRALSKGFGSVCAGGLLIGPSSLLWGILEMARSAMHNCFGTDLGSNEDDFSAIESPHSGKLSKRRVSSSSSLKSTESSIKKIQTRFATRVMSGANRYGWARVSLRATRFVPASKESWKLMSKQGVHGVVNKDLAESILRCWSWAFGSLTALISLILLPASTHQTSEILFMFFIASFGLGAANASLLLEPLRSSVGAIYMSFAEDPDCFAKDNPIVHHRLSRLCELSRFQGNPE